MEAPSPFGRRRGERVSKIKNTLSLKERGTFLCIKGYISI